MATRATKERSDVIIYVDHLKSLPFVEGVKIAASDGHDKEIAIGLLARQKEHPFVAHVLRTHLSLPELERWIGRAKTQPKKRPLLLLAPYVSRPMGARLRDAGVQYVDQVGNLHISLAQGSDKRAALVALVEGKRPPATKGADTAWRAPGYQVLFALLTKPEQLRSPVRSIAALADVSTSPVLQVQKKLLQNGFAVARHGKWQWTPRGLQEAQDFWLHGYHATLRPHLLIGRFRPRTVLSPELLEREVESSLRKEVSMRWGGAAAAQRLDPYYRGDRTVLHVDDKSLSAASMASILRMVPDPDGPLIVLRTPGPCAWESPQPDTVHPLLAWAELLEEGNDRASEAAERLAVSFLQDGHAQ